MLKNSRDICNIRWSEIKQITAGKINLLTYEPVVICLSHSENNKHGTLFQELILGFDENPTISFPINQHIPKNVLPTTMPSLYAK